MFCVVLMSCCILFLSSNFSGTPKGESVAVSIKATVGSKTYTKTKSVMIFSDPERTCLEFTGVKSGGASSPLSADKSIFSSSSDSFTRSTFTVQRKSGAAISSLDWYLERRKTDGTITSENIGRGSTADT